jgi:hypothetical protein
VETLKNFNFSGCKKNNECRVARGEGHGEMKKYERERVFVFFGENYTYT